MGRMVSQSEQSLGFSSDLAAVRNPITGIFGSGKVLFLAESTTFVVPAGVTSVRVRLWGAGSYAMVDNSIGGGVPSVPIGGCGGGFAFKTITNLTPGQSIQVTVGVPPGTFSEERNITSFGNFCSATSGLTTRQGANGVYTAGSPGEGVNGDINNSGGYANGTGGGGAGNLIGKAGAGGSSTVSTTLSGYTGTSGSSGPSGTGGAPGCSGEFGNSVSIDHIGTGGGGGGGGSSAVQATETGSGFFLTRTGAGDGSNGGGGGGGSSINLTNASTAGYGPGSGGFPGGGAGAAFNIGNSTGTPTYGSITGGAGSGLVIVEY